MILTGIDHRIEMMHIEIEDGVVVHRVQDTNRTQGAVARQDIIRIIGEVEHRKNIGIRNMLKDVVDHLLENVMYVKIVVRLLIKKYTKRHRHEKIVGVQLEKLVTSHLLYQKLLFM